MDTVGDAKRRLYQVLLTDTNEEVAKLFIEVVERVIASGLTISDAGQLNFTTAPLFPFSGDGSGLTNLTLPGITYSGTRVQQIAFAATQSPSSDPNTLDDYEEGTYTPVVESSGGGAANYTVQTGRYIKWGKAVCFQARVVLSNKGTLAAGTVTISLPPFVDASAFFPLAVGQFSGMTTAVVGLFATITAGGGSKANLYHLAAAATGTTATTVADIGTTVDLSIGGWYESTS